MEPKQPVFVYQAGAQPDPVVIVHVSPETWSVGGIRYSTTALLAKYHNNTTVLNAIAEYARGA